MGSISLTDFIAARDAAESLDKEYATKDAELTGVKANRDEKGRQLGELITRFRSGIRSAYGPDSVMYQEAGGTRSSLRRSPTRQSQPVPPVEAGATRPALRPAGMALRCTPSRRRRRYGFWLKKHA